MVKIILLTLFSISFGKAKTQTLSGDSTELCFASDTQAPMWIETLFLKKDHNKEATKKLFAAVADRTLLPLDHKFLYETFCCRPALRYG